jgi:hypothetical protein
VGTEESFPIPDISQGGGRKIAALCSPCHFDHLVQGSNDFRGFLLCGDSLVGLIHEAFPMIRGSEDEVDLLVKAEIAAQPKAVSKKDPAAVGGMSVCHEIKHRRSLGASPLGEQKMVEGGED